MKIEIDLCEFGQFLSDNPGLLFGVGLLCFYLITGFVIRQIQKIRGFSSDEHSMACMVFLCCPVLVPIIIVVLSMSIIVWLVSFGLTRPFWEWK